jgi:hypothetical protein
MNDVDEQVRDGLRRLIDPEPVDAERALRSLKSHGPERAVGRSGHLLLVAAAAAVAIVLVTVLATTRGAHAPPYRLVGAALANVVIRIDANDPQAPEAVLSVGEARLSGIEIAGIATPDGMSFGTGIELPSQTSVDVPDGSTLRIEGNFDDASASSLSTIHLGVGDHGEANVLRVETWQLDGSGGSVVFEGHEDDQASLIVQTTVGSDRHYFYFPIRIGSGER